MLVLAGAGSGKTRVLTYRVAHLILDRQVPPWRILAITFTNKAAEEMRLRLQQLLGQEETGIWVGTFHATCVRILRQHIEQLGYRRNFVIYDEADQLRVIKSCLQNLPAEGKGIRPGAVHSLMEKAKNQGIDPTFLVPRQAPLRHVLERALSDYGQRLREANALDFGDLILLTIQLFEAFPEVLRGYRERFHSILVDEYQDTNRAQHLLLRQLASQAVELCVVGDDDQSIYRWRGAEVNNLLAFEEDFPGTRILALEENYRSTQNILRAADAVAKGNYERREKRLWTRNEAGERIGYTERLTPDEEAEFVAREIQKLVTASQVRYGNVGVFFRTNAQSRPFEEKLVLFRVPHAVVGSVRFYERTEVKDLLAYLRFLYNPNDSVSLLRILNQPPRGIGAATQARLEAYAAEEGTSVWAATEQALERGIFSRAVQSRLEGFQNLIRELLHDLDGNDVQLGALLKKVVQRSGYKAFLKGKEDGERRMENVEELVRTAAEFRPLEEETPGREALGAFVQRIALVSDADQYEDRADLVSLMTLHCAKGLEFSVVFLTGLEDGVLPHQRSYASPEALAEERRLCYVGITRAKKRLYLSRSRFRSAYGERQPTEPSPFVSSIPHELIEFYEGGDGSEEGRADEWIRPDEGDSVLDYEDSQLDVPPLPQKPSRGRAQLFRVGDRLEHTSLGPGIVRRVEGSGHREKITVQFSTGGIRKLMVRVSPIRKLP